MSQTSLIDQAITNDGENDLHPRLQAALGCLQCSAGMDSATHQQKDDNDGNTPMTQKKGQNPNQEKPIISVMEEDDEYEVIPPSEPFGILEDFFTGDKQYAQGEILEEAFFTDSKEGSLVPTPGVLDIDFSPSGSLTPVSGELFGGPSTSSLFDVQSPQTKESDNIADSRVDPSPKKPSSNFKFLGAALLCMGIAGGAGYTYYYQPQLVSNIINTVSGKQTTTATTPVKTEVSTQGSFTGPNLSANEFTPLTLGRITTIKLPRLPQPTIFQPPSPTQSNLVFPPTNNLGNPPENGNRDLSDGLVKSLLPPNLQRLAAPPAPPLQPPTNDPVASKNAAKSLLVSPLTLGKNEQGGFTVITKNQHKDFFQKVKSVAPSAIVNGDRIDIARFPTQDQANKAIQELQKQGITASIKK